MANIDRRTFLRATTAVAAGAIAPDLALATDNNNKELMASPPITTPEVTKIVARYVVSARYEDGVGVVAWCFVGVRGWNEWDLWDKWD